jgi:hypothetical protein
MVKFQKTKHYNPNIQIGAMQSLYPQFKAIPKSDSEIEFVGDLSVKPELPVYTVSITYRGNLRPIAKILHPELVKDPPHCFPESLSLCLYHKDNYHWTEGKLIAKDIVPWVASWIYFYEVWKQTGTWFGPEIEHNTPKVEK